MNIVPFFIPPKQFCWERKNELIN